MAMQVASSTLGITNSLNMGLNFSINWLDSNLKAGVTNENFQSLRYTEILTLEI